MADGSPDLYGLESAEDRAESDALSVAYGLIDELTAHRIRSGLTQTEVAGRMRTSQATIAKLEGHRHDPRLSTIARYAAAIGVSAQDVADMLIDLGAEDADDVDPVTEVEDDPWSVVAHQAAVPREWFVPQLIASVGSPGLKLVVSAEAAVPADTDEGDGDSDLHVTGATILHLGPGALRIGSGVPTQAEYGLAAKTHLSAMASKILGEPAEDWVEIDTHTLPRFTGALSHRTSTVSGGIGAGGLMFLSVEGDDSIAVVARVDPV